MRKIILLLSIFCVFNLLQAQPTQDTSTINDPPINKNVRIDTVRCLVCEEGALKNDLDSIKQQLKSLQSKPAPTSSLGDFVKSKILDEIYNWIFHSNRLFVIFLSIVGILLSAAILSLSILSRRLPYYLQSQHIILKYIANRKFITIIIALLILTNCVCLFIVVNKGTSIPPSPKSNETQSLSYKYNKKGLSDNDNLSAHVSDIELQLAYIKNSIEKAENDKIERAKNSWKDLIINLSVLIIIHFFLRDFEKYRRDR